MAGCDYRSCDKCGAKTFYDAALHFDDDRVDRYMDPLPVGCGDWGALCMKCAKTHEIRIVQKEARDG